jgi:lysophospholipase L1-like esterase
MIINAQSFHNTPMRLVSLFSLSLCLACSDAVNSATGADASTPETGFSDASSPPSDASPFDNGARQPDDGGPNARDASAPPRDAGNEGLTRCFGESEGSEGPNYAPFDPLIGEHCAGTNHQDIQGVEQVVFVGDSVTVGTPPTPAEQFFRSRLAQSLVRRFNLEGPAEVLGQRPWEIPDMQGGVLQPVSGDFASCARWGARTDDLETQFAQCFPSGGSNKRTLIIFTMGGNDVAAITKAGQPGGDGVERAVELTERTIRHLRQAFTWIKEPQRFPNGVYVVFANPFEFTDATGRTETCPAAAAAGFNEPWDDPDLLTAQIIRLLEQYMALAVEFGFDLVFMMEQFCGHGFAATGADADPSSPCYLGPGAERWFDLTCIHPNPAGHRALSRFFEQVIAL